MMGEWRGGGNSVVRMKLVGKLGGRDGGHLM